MVKRETLKLSQQKKARLLIATSGVQYSLWGIDEVDNKRRYAQNEHQHHLQKTNKVRNLKQTNQI